ncbi:DUF2061 domain-containing protein [Marinimicrobium alkaliphilum]|uniref:DUF2061 domain-containing protein n=1 Tax=Marinimicrobium alkaliphilum TaxID=2202654 RepID=UPI000DB9E3D7|nr:DUF2061 domain-containing protein [Marinimicrobium alkaliphilum]
MTKTKTLSFGFVHVLVAFSVTYAITGDLVIGGAVALIEPAVNTVAYYFHEVLWKKMESHKETLQTFFAETV